MNPEHNKFHDDYDDYDDDDCNDEHYDAAAIDIVCRYEHDNNDDARNNNRCV